MSIKGFRFTFWMRLCNVSFISFFAKIMRRHYMIKFGYEISEKTKIGKMFAMVHMGGVVINDKCIITDKYKENDDDEWLLFYR